MNTARYVFVYLFSAAVLLAAVGCSSQSEAPEPSPQASSTNNSPSAAPTPAPTVASLLDPHWMGVTPSQPNGWEELNRTMTADFQQFDFRPVYETEFMRGCNGCAPWTAVLTAYAPGKFDPTDARTGQPVSVNGDNDGFFRPANETEVAMLAWQHADNTWATALGLTRTTANLDQLLELARALKPAERTPIRLPLILANLPDNMPLAQLGIDTHPETDGSTDYGTTLEFAPCGMTDKLATPKCMVDADHLSVHIWPDDGYDGHIAQQRAVPIKIGGKDGFDDDDPRAPGGHAAVQVQPGMLVEFALSGPGGRAEPSANLTDILAGVAWAPDPGNGATWPPISDWTK